MKMTGTQRISAAPQRVWQALNDPAVLRASIPGCQSLDREADDRYAAVVEVKIGPIGARFRGTVSIADIEPGKGYTLALQGNGGIAGSVKGSATVRLREEAGGTLIAYEVDAEVGGRMAQLGGPIIDATARQLAGKFFARFAEAVSGGGVAMEAPVAAAAATTTAARPAARAAGGFPLAWVLTSAITALAGFLIGRAHGVAGSDWAGLAIGLLVIVVAAAAFDFGRRSATPVVVLDQAMLRKLLGGDRP